MLTINIRRGWGVIGVAVIFVVAHEFNAAAQDVITLRPNLSIPNAEFEKIQSIVKDSSSKIISYTVSAPSDELPPNDVQVLVKNGDTLTAIVERQWGPEIKTSGVDYAALTATLRDIPANKPITSRPGPGLQIRPGDTLHLPRVISGRRKTGAIVIEVATPPGDQLAAQVATASLAAKISTVSTERQSIVSTSAGSPARPVGESGPAAPADRAPAAATGGTSDIAILADKETCEPAAAVPPFNYTRLINHVSVVSARQKGIVPTGGQIAVIDSAVNGNISLLIPYMYRSMNSEEAEDEGYGLNVPGQNGRLSSLVAGAATPRKHGTHIIGLAFGGTEWLRGRQSNSSAFGSKWQLVPIVVQNEPATGGPTIQTHHVEAAVNYARRRHAKIVNMSIEAQGVGYLNQIVDTGERGQRLYVVAAGNGQLSFNYEPARNLSEIWNSGEKDWIIPAMRGGFRTSNVITVAAHDPDGQISDFSGFSESLVDIAAPGRCVQGLTQLKADFGDSETAGISGTSQSTALVTFAASLVADIFGGDAEWSPSAIKTRLLASSIYDGTLRKKVVASGQLSIERAIAARFDILSYRPEDGPDKGKIVDLYGDLGNFEGNTLPIEEFKICARDWLYTIRQVRKIIRRGTTKDDSFFDFVPAKITGKTDSVNAIQDPFQWKWEECKANWGALNTIRFKPVNTPPIDVRFHQIVEIIPRQIAPNIPK